MADINKKAILELGETIGALTDSLNAELEVAYESESESKIKDVVESTPGAISARYWLTQFLEPLTLKELTSIVNGFLVQVLNEDQAKKIIKFLLIRYPDYYKEKEPKAEKPQK